MSFLKLSKINNFDVDKLIWYLLRFGVFLTFLGHGYFAINKNSNWISYLEVVGFSIKEANFTIFIIGFLDILVAFVILIKPYRVIIIWTVIWTFLTALIRPISGESVFAFIERGANWILPIVLYIYSRKIIIPKNNVK